MTAIVYYQHYSFSNRKKSTERVLGHHANRPIPRIGEGFRYKGKNLRVIDVVWQDLETVHIYVSQPGEY